MPAATASTSRFDALRRALADAVAGRDEVARQRLHALLHEAATTAVRGEGPEQVRFAGSLAAALGDDDLADASLAALGARPDAQSPRTRRAAAEVCVALGRHHEARALLRAADARAEAEGDVVERAEAQLALGLLHGPRGAFEAASRHLATASAVAPWPDRTRAALALEAAGYALATGDHETARAEADEGLARAPLDRAVRLEAARIHLASGAPEAAERCYRDVLTAQPDDADAREGLARIALYRGDVEACRAGAAGLPQAAAALLRGLAALVTNDPTAAEAAAEACLACGEGPYVAEAYLVRAEARLRRGALELAFADVDAGVVRQRGYAFAGRVLHKRIGVAAGVGWQPGPHAHEDYAASLHALDPALAARLETESLHEAAAVLDEALARLSGNRTVTPTVRVVRDGVATCVALPYRPSPRHAAREALQRIAVEPADLVEAAMRGVCAAHPESPTPRCHLGELQLWLGDYEAAHRSFEAALAIAVARWGYIGRGAAELLLGDPERALRTFEEGVVRMDHTTGPSLFVYRAEAHFALGALEAAERDLEHSTESSPRRIAAFALLARVRAARGDLAGADVAATRFATLARPLFVDAQRAVGRRARGYRDDADATDSVLAEALRMLRGNRSSSCHVYALEDGTLREVPLTLADPAAARALALDGLVRALPRLARISSRGR